MSTAEALAGLRVIEWTDERGAWAGKLLADMGAEVIKIEAPGTGDHTRSYAPFVDDQQDPEGSLWFWNYNANKKSITLDVTSERGQTLFRDLVKDADIVVESQDPGYPQSLGIDYDDVKATNSRLIWSSITPFGRDGPRALDVATDLTTRLTSTLRWRGFGSKAWSRTPAHPSPRVTSEKTPNQAAETV